MDGSNMRAHASRVLTPPPPAEPQTSTATRTRTDSRALPRAATRAFRGASTSRDGLPTKTPSSPAGVLSMSLGSWPTSRRLASSASPFRLLVIALVACLCFVQPAAAVLIPFENCLPDTYKNNNPRPLQWVPMAVDAVFDTENPSHNLRVVVYGNVTGSFLEVDLPPPNSSQWTDPNELNGKIVAVPDPQGANKATTLHSKVNVLTYEPWNLDTNFCQSSLVNGTCPLAPIFNTSNIVLPYGLPSFNLSNDFASSYAFSSFSATFLVIYGDEKATNIGCISTTITPDLGGLQWMLKFLPLMVLLFVGAATVTAGMFSPWGSVDIFHWTSNYGRDVDLLRLVTPGFGDCLQYIQFIALTGGLTLNYPGFYQPIASQVGWSVLMFNQSFVSRSASWQSIVDGIYFTNATYGLQQYSQLVGLADVSDVWAGMMVWLLVIIAGMLVLIQGGFFLQWIFRAIKEEQEEDLRAKNVPFSLGNIVRIVFGYFLLPIVALSTFQFVVAAQSPAFTVALASITLALMVVFAGWLLYLIISTKPRAVLFDDLPTVLLYGPLYNTFKDEAAAYALIPVILTFLRGISIGAVQPFGIAQLVLLAICEVIQILTLHAFRPFQSATWMNVYHTVCSALRFAIVLLMVAFVPSLGVTEGPKGWIGYAILLMHGMVLVLGFFLNSLQTLVEVGARRLGAGGDDVHGLTRGGLSKIFGMRQLSRRMSRRETQPSRASQLSSTAMLDAEEASKQGFVMPGGRIRSESAGSIGVLMHNNGQRSSSALESVDAYSVPARTFDGASSAGPTTPGEASTFSFLPSPGLQSNRGHPGAPAESDRAYYRPPRQRQGTLNDVTLSERPPRLSVTGPRGPVPIGTALGDPTDLEGQISRGATPAPHAYPSINLPARTDYAHREVDYYYGMGSRRGPALNSDGPGRKLGTGPADPTGPMATASGWFRNIFGGKTKEKGKGFEVVRSARMPAAMRARGGEFDDDGPPEGIPVAMGVLRNGPIESDDDEPKGKKSPRHHQGDLLNDRGDPQDSEPEDGTTRRISDIPPTLPGIERGESIKLPSRLQSTASRYSNAQEDLERGPNLPNIPRKSSKRLSGVIPRGRGFSFNLRSPDEAPEETSYFAGAFAPRQPDASASRLPFQRSGSQKRYSTASDMEGNEDFSPVDLQGAKDEERSISSMGFVPQHSISRVDPDHRRQVDLLGSSAEVVDERGSMNPSASAERRRF